MGFFYSETQYKAAKKRSHNVNVETLHKFRCKVCPLRNELQVLPSGSRKPLVYFLGGAPGEKEADMGKPFTGRPGRLLRSLIPEKYRKQVRFNYVVLRELPDGADPQFYEIESCRYNILEDIEETVPKIIVPLGPVALNWCIKETAISSWRGRFVPAKFGKHECWVFPLYDPLDLLEKRKQLKNGVIAKSDQEKVFARELKRVFAEASILPDAAVTKSEELHEGCKIFTGEKGDAEVKKIVRLLDIFTDEESVAIDIECNGLRPYANGFKILTVALSNGIETFAFPLRHKQSVWSKKQLETVEKAFVDFLYNSDVAKIAHNLSYELEVLIFFYGKKLSRATVWHDTMAQAYCLDERRGMHSLDTLCLQYFGFLLKELFDLDRKNLDDEPLLDVLKYNSLDAKYTKLLFGQQNIILENNRLQQVCRDQVRRVPTCVLTQFKGLEVDQNNVRKHQKRLGNEIEKIKEQINSYEEVVQFKRRFGSFNPLSVKDINSLFTKVIQDKQFKTGGSTRKEVLDKADHPISKDIIKLREINKLKSTYVDELSEKDGAVLWPDKKLHPILNTIFTTTRRLSSDSPNEQNFPKRKNKIVRDQITAPEGYYFFSADYGQIEARVIAMASKDKTLVAALWERYDIHTEWAEQIASMYPSVIGGKKFLKDKEVMKVMRDKAKNKMVFPAFFGSSPNSIATNLGLPKDVMYKLFDKFWYSFPGVLKWQEELVRQYDQIGYVESLTGFRRRAPLSKNEVINMPIQSTAADIVVNAMNELSEYALEEDLPQFQAIMNIHDDLSFYLPKKTLEDDVEVVVDKMLNPDFDFLNVPLSVEISIGTNWYNVKDVESYFSDQW
jgi:uracil-DNA glycosylase family 4